MQLSVKALLKPFYSEKSIETGDEAECGDNGMPALETIDDDEEEESAGDPDVDDKDEEEEEDLLGALDDD